MWKRKHLLRFFLLLFDMFTEHSILKSTGVTFSHLVFILMLSHYPSIGQFHIRVWPNFTLRNNLKFCHPLQILVLILIQQSILYCVSLYACHFNYYLLLLQAFQVFGAFSISSFINVQNSLGHLMCLCTDI